MNCDFIKLFSFVILIISKKKQQNYHLLAIHNHIREIPIDTMIECSNYGRIVN